LAHPDSCLLIMTMPTHIPRDPREYWGKAIADMRQTNQILKEEQEQTKRHLKALHIVNRTPRMHIEEMRQEQQHLMSKLTELLAAAAPSDSRLPSTKLSTKLNKVPFSVSELPQPPPGFELPDRPATGEGITNEVTVLSPGICQRRSWHSLSQGILPRALMPAQWSVEMQSKQGWSEHLSSG